MPSADEKVIEFHIARLTDKRVDVRLKSIAELEAMGAKAAMALEALKACHDQADEEEVKKAAREAGYKIFMAGKEPPG